MIIAEFNPQNHAVWFSDPNERFSKKSKPIYASSEAEVERMVYFRNREYIFKTLQSWLNQRAHALNHPDYQTKIRNLIYWLETKQGSYYSLCSFIKLKADDFKKIAPGNKSRYYRHYENIVLKIINDCKSLAN